MRKRFAQSIRRLVPRLLCLSALLHLTLAPLAAFGTDDFYINYGTITTPPQIDAFNFVNYGTFSIFTLDPFETSNTRNFTNYGSLTGASGWWFDNSPAANGVRRMADNFVNHNGGVVQGLDEPLFFFLTDTATTENVPPYRDPATGRPLVDPAEGQLIDVVGTVHYDEGHVWWEIHPVKGYRLVGP